MQYKYRFIYALSLFFMIMIIGFLYMIEPRISVLIEGWQRENHLQTTLATTKQFAKTHPNMNVESHQQINPPFSRENLLSEIVSLLQLNGLHLQSTNFFILATNRAENVALNISMSGNFQQLILFVSSLKKLSYPVYISDFSCQLTPAGALIFTINLVALSHPINLLKAEQLVSISSATPFCTLENLQREKHDHYEKKVALSQMQMVGFLGQKNLAEGLVLLPNKQMVSVYVGDLLGKEQGIVKAVSEDRILLQLRKEWVVLPLQGVYS